MDGYGQYCPLAKGAEVFAERWTPLILRELLRGSTTFNDLHRGVPRMSRSLLSNRLKKLEACGVVKRRRRTTSTHYDLTPAGHETAAKLTSVPNAFPQEQGVDPTTAAGASGERGLHSQMCVSN
jgi:DNA-binding HxlR family transcriptional regulator